MQIVLLQSCLRQWLAKRRVDKVRTDAAEKAQLAQNLEDSLISEKDAVLHNEHLRRTHPKTKSDFDLVYKTIEGNVMSLIARPFLFWLESRLSCQIVNYFCILDWKKGELAKINEALDGPERKALLCKLHKGEVGLLTAVEAQKIAARDGQDERARDRLLDKLRAPIKFMSCGTVQQQLEMETPDISRAKELVQLYYALLNKKNSKSERLDLLLSVTTTVAVR